MRNLFNKVWRAFDGLAKDTIWGASMEMANIVVGLSSVLLLQLVYAEDKYGSYAALYATIAPLNAFTFAGPGLAAVKAKLRDNKSGNETLKSYLSLVIISGILFSFFAVPLISVIADDFSLTVIIFFVLSELFGIAVIFVVSNLLQASTSYSAMIRVRLGTVSLKFLALITLAVLDPRIMPDNFFLHRWLDISTDTETLTFANLGLSYLILYSLYGCWLIMFHLPNHGFKVKLGIPAKKAVTESSHFALPMSAAQLQMNGDKAALRYFDYESESGLYALGYRAVLLGTAPLRVLDDAAFQRFLPDKANQKNLHLKRSFRFASLMFAVSLVLVLFLYLFRNLIIDFFVVNESYSGVADMYPWMLSFIPLMALSGTPMNGLIGLGRVAERGYIYICSAAVSLLLYFLLIPPYGWQGALVATVLSELFLAVASWIAIIFFQRKTNQQIAEETIGFPT